MTEEKFQEITNNCQPQKGFNLNWSIYYPLDFSDTFLPKIIGHRLTALDFFDGADLLTNINKVRRESHNLTNEKEIFSLISYTYPRGVEAGDKKSRVEVQSNEICTFIEVTKNNDISVFFRFGNKFKNKLIERDFDLEIVEKKGFKTTISAFQSFFKDGLTHQNMMCFILKTIGMEDYNEQEIKDQQIGTNIVKVNEDGTTLMQVRHELVNVGERIAQTKYNTAATVTNRGTIIVTQFKQEVASRDKEVFYFKNALGTFEGTLSEAREAFPDVDFSELIVPTAFQRNDVELGTKAIWATSKPLEWETVNEYDAEQHGGKPIDWEKWADATQTALDIIGLIPVVGEVADCLNGIISLARGDYADAALSFASMIPVLGSIATGVKRARKATKKTAGVYDLMVKNLDEINGYVGQSKSVFKRISNHFKPKGKLKHTILENAPIIYKMPGSTKFEREIYEQFVIIEKYKKSISNSGNTGYLLNKVNPVGGRFVLDTKEGEKVFLEKALEIAKKYNLPTEF